MEKINIEINQAKLINYRVELKDDRPSVTACIGLYSGEKKISEFSLSTENYYGGIQFELPLNLVNPIMKIAQQLQTITIAECSKTLMELPAPDGEAC